MVYRGIDSKTGQVVAIKIVHPDVAAAHGDELLKAAGVRIVGARVGQCLQAFFKGRDARELLGHAGVAGSGCKCCFGFGDEAALALGDGRNAFN